MKRKIITLSFLLLLAALSVSACSTPEVVSPEPQPAEALATETISVSPTPDFQENLVACTPENQAAWLAAIDPVLEELGRNTIDLSYNTATGGNINYEIERSLSEGFLGVLDFLSVPDCLIRSQQSAYAAINAHIAALDSWHDFNPALASENLEGQEQMGLVFDSLRKAIRSASMENIELGVASVLSME